MREWPRTQVHVDYDVAAAKERLRLETRRPYVGWVDISQHYYAKVYDPTRPRVLDRRQAETMPWLLEAILITVITIAAVGILIMASLSSRG